MDGYRLERLLAPLRTRVAILARRFIIRLIDEAPKLRTAQLTGFDGETLQGVEVFGQYGFDSRPLDGAEAIGLALGGSRDHTVIIASADRRYKISLESGEVAIHDDQGQKVHLKRTGIEVYSPLKVEVTAGGSVTVEALGAATLKAAGAATLEAGGVATVKGATVVLGTGGAAVARVGDAVSGGNTIIGGSAQVSAG
jgi:phage baseplate assembly protein V